MIVKCSSLILFPPFWSTHPVFGNSLTSFCGNWMEVPFKGSSKALNIHFLSAKAYLIYWVDINIFWVYTCSPKKKVVCRMFPCGSKVYSCRHLLINTKCFWILSRSYSISITFKYKLLWKFFLRRKTSFLLNNWIGFTNNPQSIVFWPVKLWIWVVPSINCYWWIISKGSICSNTPQQSYETLFTFNCLPS